ncbi:MAG: NAD-dependent DNA ligase LigA [Chitinophagaceae bacterium]|nr:NAD-dependent DNA ligase LigA [Chitinophagaceae bacterium]
MFSQEEEKKIIERAKSWQSKNLDEILFPQEAINDLIEIINYADWKYYVEDNNIIADVEYDFLFSSLKKLEENHPAFISEKSPTQRIAKGLNTSFPSVKHLVPMLSLDNSYNAEDLNDWHNRNVKLLGDEELKISYCVEPKYDGASISLVYEKNNFIRAATRGNGIEGDDISQNAKQIRSIPLHGNFLENQIEQIEIRGEAVIPKEKFKRLNEQLIAENSPPLANPRNAASGSLRMKNPADVSKRNLAVFVYHISDINAAELPYKTHFESLLFLKKLGFLTSVDNAKVFSSIEEVISFCNDFEAQRDNLDFEIDGLVIKVNDLVLQEKIGMTSHHPRWAMAYKFKARQATSKLLQIDYQVGRTGSITPVGKIEPVYVGGVTVSSLSLFNEEVMQEKNLMLGDTILIERAGDVIPYIVKSFPELRDGNEQEICFPKNCPVCETALIKPEEEAVWRCPNFLCKAQMAERMIHYVSKDALDIKGLGEANIRKFFEEGIIKSLLDIYNLPYEKIKNWDGFGEKSITKMQEAIELAKQQPLHRLIFALGIRYVGETTAKVLAQSISNLKELMEKNIDELLLLDDVGIKVAQSIVDFFANEDNKKLIFELETLGQNLQNTQKDLNTEGGLSGKTFLFTGTLPTLGRKQAEEMAEAQGAKILSGVSTKLNFLVAGEAAGSKLDKAKKLGTVSIIDENTFLELLKN